MYVSIVQAYGHNCGACVYVLFGGGGGGGGGGG